jgi:hypothetical protein
VIGWSLGNISRDVSTAAYNIGSHILPSTKASGIVSMETNHTGMLQQKGIK